MGKTNNYLEPQAIPSRPRRQEGEKDGHIKKKNQRNKTLEVVFDPKDHKCVLSRVPSRPHAPPCMPTGDQPCAPTPSCALGRDYLTGFRKRKQQRRKDALKSLEMRQKQQRVEERAQVRPCLPAPARGQALLRRPAGAALCSAVNAQPLDCSARGAPPAEAAGPARAARPGRRRGQRVRQ